MKNTIGIMLIIANAISGIFYYIQSIMGAILTVKFADIEGPIYAYDQLMTGIIKDRTNFDAHEAIYKDREDIGFLTKLFRDSQKEKTTTNIGNYWEQRSRKRFTTAASSVPVGTGAGATVDIPLPPADASGITKNMTLTLRVILAQPTHTNDVIVIAKSGNTITVKPNDKTKIIAPIPDGSKILVRGNSYAEGTLSNETPTVVLPKKYNFVTQLFKNNYKLSRTAKDQRMYGEDERARVRLETERDHLEDLEWSFLFNEAAVIEEATTDSNIQRGTFAGIFRTFKNRGNWDSYDTFSYEVFRDFVTKKIFNPRRIDGKQKTRLCLINTAALNYCWQLNEDKRIIMNPTDLYGVDGVIRAQFANGTLDLFEHPDVNDYYDVDKPFFSFLHMRYILERPFLQTLFQANIQPPNADGIEDQYITETSIMVAMPELGGGYEPRE